MNTIEPQFSSYYALLKHFQKQEYAEQFLRGELYLNSLDLFRAINKGASIDSQNKQNDGLEGSVPIKKDSLTKQVYSALGGIDEYIAYDPVFIFDEYKYSHLLCFSTIDFYTNSISTINPTSMNEFGTYLVLIHDKAAFRERVFKALSAISGILYLCGRVRYHSPTLDGKPATAKHSLSLRPDTLFDFYDVGNMKSPIRDCFDKSISYAHQREWRLWLYKKNWDTNPIHLEVGDLHDIATLASFETLGEKIRELDSQSMLTFQEEGYGLMYGNIHRKSLRKQILDHNSTGRLAFHIG